MGSSEAYDVVAWLFLRHILHSVWGVRGSSLLEKIASGHQCVNNTPVKDYTFSLRVSSSTPVLQ